MTPIQLEQKTQLEEFERQGVLSVPNALTPTQILAFNREIDNYLKQFPEEWIHFDASLVQTVNVLPRTSVSIARSRIDSRSISCVVYWVKKSASKSSPS